MPRPGEVRSPVVLAAYQFIVEHPGCTSKEIERAIDAHHISSRLTTLEAANLVEPRRAGEPYHMTWWPL